MKKIQKMLIFVISIHNTSIKQSIRETDICAQQTEGNIVCFVALSPKSTAMFMAGGSVHLTTLFLGQA